MNTPKPTTAPAVDQQQACSPLLESALALLRSAKCPNCDGSGAYYIETGGCDMDGENDTRESHLEQCQWCDELATLLANDEARNGPR